MARLVICEKPSVAKDVAAAFRHQHQFTREDWGFRSDALWVTAAAGHLVAEAPPEHYDEGHKNWSYEALPIVPDEFAYIPRDKRGQARLKVLHGLCNDTTVTEIVNACDAGREGELIFKLVYAYLGVRKPVLRAWFSSMTPTAITAAFAALRPDRDMLPLEAAARSRAEADWLVGMNATRAATTKLGGGRTLLSVGRVQTPTLALVVERDLEIERFVPEDYYTLSGTFRCADGNQEPEREFVAWWRSTNTPDGVDRLSERADLEAVAAAVEKVGAGIIDDVTITAEKIGPPKLFDLTTLQREANKKYGMTAAKTLAAAQACYEEHKVLSYPRTDSMYLPSDMAAGVSRLVERVRDADPTYAAAAGVVLASCDPTRLIDDSKVTDHHALVPTDDDHDLSALTVDQRRIYDLVARRLLAALLDAQELDRTVAWVKVDTEPAPTWFRASGRHETKQGWRLAWPERWGETTGTSNSTSDSVDDDNDDDGTLCPLSTGEHVDVTDTTVWDRKTKAPAAYNEASLLAAMSTAGKLVDDDELADAMSDSGLGTPATRASIIERLVTVEYLARSGRKLQATDKGRGLVKALGSHPLTLPDLTGGWEKRLRELERCDPATVDEQRARFADDVRTFTREIVGAFAEMTPALLDAGRRKLAKCPLDGCDGDIIEGRKGWGCTSWKSRDDTGCGFVWWKEQGGKKRTVKQLQTYVAKVAAGTETFVPAGPKKVLAPCPRDGCDGDILVRAKSYGCSSWRSPSETGCGYVIWRTGPDGEQVSEAEALEFIAAGKTNERERVVLVACPFGDGDIVDRGKLWGCSSWKSHKEPGCGIVVWKQNRGTPVSEDEARAAVAYQGEHGPPERKPAGRKRRATKK